MTTEVIAQAIGAGGTIFLGQGRIFYVKTCASAINIIARKIGTSSSVINIRNIGAGFKFIRELGQGWDTLEITSAAAQNLEIILSDDDVEISNAVSVVGVASVSVAAYTAIVANTQLVVANTNKQSVAANLSRKAITLANPSTLVQGSVFLQSPAAGPGLGIEIQNGTFLTINNTDAFDLRNDSGGAVTINVFEQT